MLFPEDLTNPEVQPELGTEVTLRAAEMYRAALADSIAPNSDEDHLVTMLAAALLFIFVARAMDLDEYDTFAAVLVAEGDGAFRPDLSDPEVADYYENAKREIRLAR